MKTRIISLLKSNRYFAFSLVLVLVAVAAVSVMNVGAQCKQWQISGDWAMEQSNGYKVTMHTQQNGTAITGTASYLYDTKQDDGISGNFGGSGLQKNGNVSGNIAGSDYYVEISFEDGGVGVYRGTVNAQGIIEGTGYPRIKPNEKSNFFSTRAMRCIDKYLGKPAAPTNPSTPTAPARTGKVVQYGHPKTPPTAPVNTPPAAPKKLPPPPYIVSATAQIRLVGPGQKWGWTRLTWDGGADHPYAEVWVKIDGKDEIKVLEQGKGSKMVKVLLGSTDTYILTDDGVTLATVTVSARN